MITEEKLSLIISCALEVAMDRHMIFPPHPNALRARGRSWRSPTCPGRMKARGREEEEE